MGIFSGLAKVALSPIKGVVQIADDLSGNDGESSQGLSILTCGLSSVIKGTAKGLKSGSDDIFNN